MASIALVSKKYASLKSASSFVCSVWWYLYLSASTVRSYLILMLMTFLLARLQTLLKGISFPIYVPI